MIGGYLSSYAKQRIKFDVILSKKNFTRGLRSEKKMFCIEYQEALLELPGTSESSIDHNIQYVNLNTHLFYQFYHWDR